MKYVATLRVEFEAADRVDADRVADQFVAGVIAVDETSAVDEVHRVAA